MRRWVERLWYDGHPLHRLLIPLSWLFGLLVRLRRQAYRLGWRRVHHLPVPVIVVGNITAGGAGKTPVVLALLERLQAAGYQPGVVSRGYGGRVRRPTPVLADSSPAEVGDEPVLIAALTGCPVVVAPDRVKAARLLAAQGATVIVADDGLQHYALHRDIELAVVDGRRRQGNGHLLPAGPLREPLSRLEEVDLVLVTGPAAAGELAVAAEIGPAEQLVSRRCRSLAEFSEVEAVAGIAEPEKFFQALEAAGLSIRRHPFPDHYAYQPKDLALPGDRPILLTGKDAVKCRHFHNSRLWLVRHRAQLPEAAWQQILAGLDPVRTMNA